MIRCCSKFMTPLVQSRSGSPICLGRFYVASTSNDFTQRRHASGSCKEPKKWFKKVFFTTMGLTIIGVGGVVVYAKQDPEFRKLLESYLPGTDEFIKFIYQDAESLMLESIKEQLSSIQEKVVSLPTDLYKQITGDKTTPPTSTSPKESKKERKPQDESKPTVDSARIPAVADKVIQVTSDATATAAKISSVADEAIKLFNDAIHMIQESGNELIDLIDKSVEKTDQKTWNQIRKKLEENQKVLDQVKNTQKTARDKVKQYSSLLKSTSDSLPEAVFKQLKSQENGLINSDVALESFIKTSRIEAASKYYYKIEEARKHFSEELTTLFPSVRLSDKQLKLSEGEIDLFLYYASQKLLYYQKELNKLETLNSERLKKAIQDSDNASLIQESIDTQLGKARRTIKEDYDRKMLELKAECDKEVHNQMKRQEQVHIDLLNDQLKLKEKEVERKLLQRLEDRVLEEQGRLQAELADMTGRMKGLNEAISKRALQDQKALTSQALWSAVEALHASLKNSHSDEDWSEKLKPLTEIITNIKKAAAKGDDLVETVLATIPSTALTRGIYPEDALRERFLNVERAAWRVAGVPEEGASLPILLVAWLQSALIIKDSEPIPATELANEPIDPSTLNNYDIIQRARYWVDRGDFEQALRYMNLLRGGARAVALDWVREVTLLLETEQAASLLLAHASASGMIYS